MTPFDNPARAQQTHQHTWGIGWPLTIPLISFETEYLRCGEVTRIYIDLGPAADMDECTNYSSPCPLDNYEYEAQYPVSWSDGGAGGQFGYVNASGAFVPSNNPNEISHYKASDTQTRTVHITLTVDDAGLLYDDPWMTNPAYNGNLTVWEFTISDSCGDGWRPQLDTDLTYAADIDPTYDHYGNLMAGTIEFQLTSSQEPGYCLNATRMDDIWHFHYWYHTGSADIDLKFFPVDQQPWPGLNVWSSSSEHGDNYGRATTTEEVNIAQAKLRCFDYGAFGSIHAAAYGLTFPTEEPIVARLEGTLPDDYIFQDDIPTDKMPAGGNRVADVWDSSHGLGAKPGGWDEENNPQTGDNAAHDNFKGDGYTYYEEYRGLEVNGAWTTMEPDWKEVFVYDEDNLDVVDYHASGLIPYVSHTDTEMTGDNVVNMFRDTSNHPELHLAQPQHGLWLVNGDNNSFCTQDPNNLGIAAGGPNGPPGNKTQIIICVANHQGTWGGGAQARINSTIAHELAHGSNVFHHGPGANRHVVGNANHPAGAEADPYDGDLCHMQYWFVAADPIAGGFCDTPVPFANGRDECQYQFKVRDAP
jgi:hypothetical protein